LQPFPQVQVRASLLRYQALKQLLQLLPQVSSVLQLELPPVEVHLRVLRVLIRPPQLRVGVGEKFASSLFLNRQGAWLLRARAEG